MDKRVIFAVAGSGKTTHIVNRLEEDTRALIVTYTNNNLENLNTKIKKKFGYMPEGITLLSYFSFVYTFCFRPYLLDEINSSGILFQDNPKKYARKTQEQYYLSASRRLYSNRIALLVKEMGILDAVRERIEKYYDHFIVDEVQDISAHDFNLLMELVTADVNTILVGDYYQYTYDTSRDGNVRKNLHKNFDEYAQEFKNAGLVVDVDSLKKSFRCSPSVCSYVSENLGIKMESHTTIEPELRELSDSEIDAVMNDDNIIKLFYNNSSRYRISSRNWGDSKGEDRYNDVCVVLNPTTYAHYEEHTLDSLKLTTKTKLYVAITRARGNVYFLEQKKIDKYRISY